MRKNEIIGRTKDGEPLYFIGYSIMKYNGKPLLLCNTYPNATPQSCGHYTEEYLQKTRTN